jgi:hypothetical protein
MEGELIGKAKGERVIHAGELCKTSKVKRTRRKDAVKFLQKVSDESSVQNLGT